MPKLLIHGARVLTMTGAESPARGANHADLGVVPCGDILIQNGLIANVTNQESDETDFAAADETIDADGRVLMPSFVDCHTHACWAGCRLDEWEQKLAGANYLDILKAGGGIMSTVQAVRNADEQELTDLLLLRLDSMLSAGTTTVEVKSGYGLTTADELKMLRSIAVAQESWPGTVVPTACIGHAFDPEVDQKTFVHRTITETLPAVSAEFPGIALDAYCEEGAWAVADCLRLFEAAAKLGHSIRVHADQFNSLGMIDEAVSRNFLSVDHLEATKKSELEKLAASNTFGVMLPACGFHMDGRYADARGFIDAGGALALATNYNPGSAPCFSVPAIIGIAVRNLGITPAEAITATTVNPAKLLGLSDRGSIEPGKRADLILLQHCDERMLGFEFGDRPVDTVICAGEFV